MKSRHTNLVKLILITTLFSLQQPLVADSEALMKSQSIEVANDYYGAFTGKNSIENVPMADDLRFVSPRMTLDGPEPFKDALRALFTRVNTLEITDKSVEKDVVLTFYNLDLGVPGGPIPMAEKLWIVDGELAEINLLFDSARLPAPAND